MTIQDNTSRTTRSYGLKRLTTAACFDTYERIAPVYDAFESLWEVSWKKRLRRMLFTDLQGRILDAGVGTGLNIPYYPADAEIVGGDLSPKMLGYAATRARKHGREVALMPMDLRHIELPDDHFDGIVSAFVFCTLSDQDRLAALRELRRICKPDGTIRILDYSLSERPVMRLVMRCCEPCASGPTWPIVEHLSNAGHGSLSARLPSYSPSCSTPWPWPTIENNVSCLSWLRRRPIPTSNASSSSTAQVSYGSLNRSRMLSALSSIAPSEGASSSRRLPGHGSSLARLCRQRRELPELPRSGIPSRLWTLQAPSVCPSCTPPA